MIKKKLFQIETEAQCKPLSNINYGSNYNEIFEDHNPELERQTPAYNRLNIYLSSKSSSETDYRDENYELFQDDGLVNIMGRNSQGNKNPLFY